MAQEIEDFLMEKFVGGVVNSKVHQGKLKNLMKTLNQLKSQFETTEIRGHLYYLNNLLDECLRLSIKFPLSIIIPPLNVPSFREARNLPEVLPPPASTPHYASADPPTVHGFDEELIAVERLLLPRPGSNGVGKFKAVGITSVAGVGKTTLCKELLERQGVRDHFIPRICVQLSKHEKEEDVVKKILDSLGVEEGIVNKISKENKFEGLVCALFAQLMGKRYLIVLDNACSRVGNELGRGRRFAYPTLRLFTRF